MFISRYKNEMNKKGLLSLSFLLLSHLLFATGQRAELIIYKGDTFALYTEPLYNYLNTDKNSNKLKWLYGSGCSTALWRGYQALWRISEGHLTLIDVYHCADTNQSIRKTLFPNIEGEIVADWFTGPLYIQQGKTLKYVQFGFESIAQQETQINIVAGKIQLIVEYTNGIRADDRGFPRDSEKIAEYIYQHLNWELFPRLSKKIYLSPFFAINSQGNIANIKLHGKADTVYQNELSRVLETMPRLRIFYKRNEGYEEYQSVPIIFSKTMKKKYIH
jgi:hypothetical protein